jgi:alpha-ribazole phosphatase
MGRRTDTPLCEKGRSELEKLSGEYEYPRAEAFFSSPLRRCTQSLEILYPGAEPRIVDGLAECDFGDFEGKTITELSDDPRYRDWIAKKGVTAPPNGESAGELQQRCCGAFERIAGTLLKSGTTRAVIMAHGGTIMALLGTFGYPKIPGFRLTANGTGYELILTPSLWMSARAFEIGQRVPEGYAGTERQDEDN